MSIDCHLKLDGVEGESTHVNHKGEIVIHNWEWDLFNKSNVEGGGMGVGKGMPGNFLLHKKYDKSSPVISKYCASGKHFASAKLSMSLAGGKQEDFLVITLKEVFITHHQMDASSDGEVMDKVSMSFSDIEYTYKPQKPDGTFGGEVKSGWNLRTTEVR